MHKTIGTKEFSNCLIFDAGGVYDRLGFKKIHYPTDKQIIIDKARLHTLVFVTKGKLNIYLENKEQFVVDAGSIFFVTKGDELLVDVVEQADLFLLHFEEYQGICNQDIQLDYSDYINKDGSPIRTLPLNKSLEHFLEGLDSMLSLGVKCSSNHELKMKELFYLLKIYFKPQEIANLMRAIFDSDFRFKNFILNNYLEIKNASDLVELSGMGRTLFFEQFKKVFGMSVKQWLIQKKADDIAKRLSEPNATIKEVMLDFGFSSASQFNRFCRYYLGNTPSNIISKVQKAS